MIDYIVGNCHVGDSYLYVVRYVLSRMAGKRKAFLKLSRAQRRSAIKKIIKAHRSNRNLALYVFRGIR